MAARKVRVGLAGIGNCASALVQGLSRYGAGADGAGLMEPEIGGLRVRDVEVAAAFDVGAAKVGRDVAEAVFAAPNNTLRFADVAPLGVVVRRGPTLDGIGRYLRPDVPESAEEPADVAGVLVASGVDVLVSYLPVGAERATAFYAEAALAAGCAFVNCVPVFVASDPRWAERFARKRLPLIGDDVKSQLGATIVHRALARLCAERGVAVASTYQLNVGGNADFKNMLERERLESKKISKTRAVVSQMAEAASGAVHIGPSDYVPFLEDRKVAFIRLEGQGFGGAPMSIELRMEVWDSPNSAGVVVDAVRCAKLALERGEGGVLEGPSAWYMKSPARQMTDAEARAATARFVAGDPVMAAAQ